MKKAVAIVLLLAVMVCSLYAANIDYDSAVREIIQSLASFLGQNTTVAFVKMESDSEAFADRFTSDIERGLINRDCAVVDRKNIDAIIAEMEFQTSGLVNEDQAVSVGNMLGAQMIITATATNIVSSYHIDVKLIDVETALTRRHLTYDLTQNTNLLNIMRGSSSNIGSQKAGIGVRLGASFQFNKAHEDMVGDGTRPAEKSPVGFVPTISAFYRVTETLKVQLEASFFTNNGIKVIGFYDDYSGRILDIDVKYSTLDIPLLVSWNLIREPVNVDIFAGAYISLPVSTANISYDIEGYGTLSGSVNVTSKVFGVVGGFDAGFGLGPGNIVLDARFFYDLQPSKAKGDFTDNEEVGLIYRKGMVVSVGYVFEI